RGGKKWSSADHAVSDRRKSHRPLGARVPAPRCSRHVWPGSPLFRRERDQARLLDPATSANPELPAELECSANRPAARCQGQRTQPRPATVGLVPYWAKDLKVRFANINAKAEGIETRPAFREAFQRRRCWSRSITSTSGCDVKSCV